MTLSFTEFPLYCFKRTRKTKEREIKKKKKKKKTNNNNPKREKSMKSNATIHYLLKKIQLPD